MQRLKARPAISLRLRKRNFVDSVSFPRWVVSLSILIIGFVFWLGAAADPALRLPTTGIGSIFYFAALAGTAAVPLYAGTGRQTRRDRYEQRFRFRGGH